MSETSKELRRALLDATEPLAYAIEFYSGGELPRIDQSVPSERLLMRATRDDVDPVAPLQLGIATFYRVLDVEGRALLQGPAEEAFGRGAIVEGLGVNVISGLTLTVIRE